MAGINGVIGAKEALIGFISRRKSNTKLGGFAGFILDMQMADLMKQVANSPSGDQSMINPADLAISNRLKHTSTIHEAGARNADLSRLRLNTADAALSNANQIVGRLSELSAMATNPILSSSDREVLNQEAQQLQTELSNMRDRSTFNGQPVLQGSSISTLTGESSVSYNDADLDNVTTELAGLDLSTSAGASAGLDSTSDALNALNRERASIGATTNMLSRAADMARSTAANAESAAVTIEQNEMGTFGSLFGPSLAGAVNELIGVDF